MTTRHLESRGRGPLRIAPGPLCVFAVWLSLFVCFDGGRTANAVETRRGTITIPTYPWGPDDVNPHFQWTHGRPIYPYPMQDNLSREKVDRTYDTLVLENEYLRVTVIPVLGGHVHSVFDKTADREMFYVNEVVKPGLIGLRGAWISGGIEFNTGPQGHTVTAVSPLSCRFVEHDDGSRSIAIGTIERVFRTQWVAVVTLRPGRCFLEERIRLYNPTPYVQPYYFWNCTAVPNTDGMRFMYPMTLGTDHAGTSFYDWPVNDGIDLSWSKNYRKPSSIFAYECDQDFFGSYDYDADHGVVAYANHHELPGKKAWTWGRGPEGIAAMATLTDDGSWYNEVQTGPLRTQADYGLLQPHQTLEWREWWYPVHGIGGYEFATRDMAVNVTTGPARGSWTVRMIGTGSWENAECRVLKGNRLIASKAVSISPERPTEVVVDASTAANLQPPFRVEIAAAGRTLASFTHPLPLPKREPPDLEALENPMETARDHWAAGVLADKQSKPLEARRHFGKALDLQPDFAPAHRGLAILDLEAGLPRDAKPHLEKILERNGDNGWAHYYLAEALLSLGDEEGALHHAWRAARDRATDSLGLGLAGLIHIRREEWRAAARLLQQAVGKDKTDVLNLNLLATALANSGRPDDAVETLARALEADPLDPLAAYVLALSTDRSDQRKDEIETRLREEPQTVLEMAALCCRTKIRPASVVRFLQDTSLAEGAQTTPVTYYYAAYFADLANDRQTAARYLEQAAATSPDRVFPHRLETIDVLKHAARLRPNDWHIHHYLGCLYLAHYRRDEAIAAWKKAAALDAEYSVLHRNLAIVRWKLDDDREAAISHLQKAIALRPQDLTLYRDLATLYQRADRWADARDLLEKTLAFERYRTDVIEQLARTYHHLGEDAKAAALIDSREFHQWEAQRSLHNIFKDVHVALGKKALEADDAETAIAEFRRALEYPPNLGVGRHETAREAEQYYWLGKALDAAGRADDAVAAWKRAASEGSRQPGDYPDKAAQLLKSHRPE